ncbi:MAG: class I SAM-dependent methyltransferase [Isosphaeraceae bacterium]
MIKNAIHKIMHTMGYEARRIRPDKTRLEPGSNSGSTPPAVDPIWPLPRRPGGLSDQEIRDQFARFPLWHYNYKFEGGLSFPISRKNADAISENPKRPLQRFRHFMPYLIEAMGGTLQGKRILDIACNSGFWSVQCGLLGADVVGFDARPELIEQANLIKSIVGLDHVDFRVLNLENMEPGTLGQFDGVLNLGILYHLADPLAALVATKAMAKRAIVVDTTLWPSVQPIVHYFWEEPIDIRDASTAGIVGHPTKGAIELMLKHIGVASFREIPLSTTDMPSDYLEGQRASWLVDV